MVVICMGIKFFIYIKKRMEKDCNVYKKSKNILNVKKFMERER